MSGVVAWEGGAVGDLLGLESLGEGRHRSRFSERNENGRIYGGQLLGQALMAARADVAPERRATYMQFLFLAGGLTDTPVEYQVATLQDGKRFSSRHVRGSQPGGRVICDASVSFSVDIASPDHQDPPPAELAFDPEALPELDAISAPGAHEVEQTLNYTFRPHAAIDFRPAYIEDLTPANRETPRMRFFIRVRHRLPDDPSAHEAAFAYLSDFWINYVACVPHVAAMARADLKLYVASLNHAIWLHRPLRADDWLYFDCQSPSGALGRGLSVARVYQKSGELVASATQECLLAPA